MNHKPTAVVYGVPPLTDPEARAKLCSTLFDAIRVILMRHLKEVEIEDPWVFCPTELWQQSLGEVVFVTISGCPDPLDGNVWKDPKISAGSYNHVAKEIALAFKDLLPGTIKIRVQFQEAPTGIVEI